MTPDSELAAAREALATSRRIVVLTGAGVSAESGVPTFRNAGGMWEKYDPGELATPEGFRRDPRRVWEWYELRRRTILACHPNPGHDAIARLLQTDGSAVVLTQNVDGLHGRALGPSGAGGVDSARGRVVELHGNLLRTRCSACSYRFPESDPDAPAPVDTGSAEALPVCPRCRALLRPDVVWFGEPPRRLDRAFELAAAADICLVVGTSGVVHPAASLPLATIEGGGLVIEVNPEPTALTRMARLSLRGPSGRLLPQLLS